MYQLFIQMYLQILKQKLFDIHIWAGICSNTFKQSNSKFQIKYESIVNSIEFKVEQLIISLDNHLFSIFLLFGTIAAAKTL